MYSSGEVDRIGKLRTALLNDYGRGNQLREVVHGEFRKDFLVDVLHLFCVEMNEAECVFEMAEGSLNTPSSGIEEFEFGGRECVGREIGNDGFKRRIGKAEPNYTKAEIVGKHRLRLFAFRRQIIKDLASRYFLVFIALMK